MMRCGSSYGEALELSSWELEGNLGNPRAHRLGGAETPEDQPFLSKLHPASLFGQTTLPVPFLA